MLPTRACAQSPPPAYDIPRRLMPDCADLPEPPGPLSVPPQLDVLVPDAPVINFGCFVPSMTTELRSTDSTTAMEHRVTAKDGDPCQFNLHTTLDLPKFVVDPINNPPCGFFNAEVSTSFGKYRQAPDGMTPAAKMPYATSTLSNYAVSAKPLSMANAKTKVGAKVIAGAYAIQGTVDEKCDRFVLKCKAPPISYMVTWSPAGMSSGSNGVIDSFCSAQQSMMLGMVGTGPGTPYFNWVRFNSLGVATFDVFKVNGGGTRTLVGTTSLSSASGLDDTPEHGAWCAVDLVPGLQVKIDAALEGDGQTAGGCYDIALSVGDEIDVAVCKDDSEPCNKHLSIDFVFPRILGDPRFQSHSLLLGAVYSGNNNYFKPTVGVVAATAAVEPGACYPCKLYDDEGAQIGSGTYQAYNGTGRTLTPGESVVVELPGKNPECTAVSSDPLACRQHPTNYCGYLTLPGAASNASVSSDAAELDVPDFTAVYRTPAGWQQLDNKLNVPAVCGIVMNKTVIILGEIVHNGTPGAVYYAGATAGSISTTPPPPATETVPANEQWVRVLGLQVTATKVLVKPEVIPFRTVPVAMCQGEANFNYRLGRFGAF